MPKNKSKSLVVKSDNADLKFSDVYIRSTGQHVAKLYRDSGHSTYRYRLDNYPHRTSKSLSLEECLNRIEKEVL